MTWCWPHSNRCRDCCGGGWGPLVLCLMPQERITVASAGVATAGAADGLRPCRVRRDSRGRGYLAEQAFRRTPDQPRPFRHMPERFFAARQIDDVAGPAQALVLLSGPPSSGKTSLLFQYALNCASASNRNVVFICDKRRLESKPPFLSQGIEPSSDVLHRIQMKYIEDDDGLKKYFAAFHLHDIFPSAVIIDDFGDFFSNRNCQDRYGNARGRDLAMVRTLALCRDAIMQANEKIQSKEYCKLLIADTHQGDSPRFLFIYKRWIQCIFTIQGNSSGSFLLRSVTTSGGRSGRMKTAKYSIALQYLILEEIAEECEALAAKYGYKQRDQFFNLDS